MGYSSQQAKDFINQIAPIIQEVSRNRGYKVCSTVIAQAIVESAAGTSSLGYKYHNYFGMKCGSSWKGKSVNLSTKEEYQVGNLVTIKDNFRVFDDMKSGVEGYYSFINTNRYSNLKGASNYKQYAQYLKNDGYATSSSYVSTLCSVVSKYGLDSYDTKSDTSVEYYPTYTGSTDSIITALAMCGEKDTSRARRKVIYEANGGQGIYSGTATQNTQMLIKIKSGKLIKP